MIKNALNILLIIFLFFIFIICNSLDLHAQTGWVWGAGGGGSGNDGYCVATDNAGNAYGGGINYGASSTTFGSLTVPCTGLPLSGWYFSPMQAVWVKYSPTGTPLWADGTQNGDAYLFNISCDASGNLLVFGAFDSPEITIGGTTITNPSYVSGAYYTTNQYFIAKYSPTGTLLWVVHDGCTLMNYTSYLGVLVITTGGIASDAAGNVYVTSSFTNASINIGPYTLTNSDPSGSTNDVFVAKYSSTGSLLWAKNIGGASDDYGNGITVTPSNDVYITGAFYSPSIPVGASTLSNPYGGGGSLGGGVPMAYVAEFSGSGTPLWGVAAGGANGALATGVTSDLSNNVYVTGGFGDASISFGSSTITRTYPAAVPQLALFLVQFSSSHAVTWTKTIGSSTAPVYGFCIGLAGCGEVWVSGNYSADASIDGHTLTLVSGTDPVFIAGYNLGGGVIGYSGLGSGGDDQNGIAVDPSGNIFICSDYQDVGPFYVGPDLINPSSTGTGTEFFYIGKYSNPPPPPDTIFIAHDTTICATGSSLTLSGTIGYSNFLWDNGSTDTFRTVTTAGTYWVLSKSSCSVPTHIDTFHVYVGLSDTIRSVHDTSFCSTTSSLNISGATGYTNYTWNTSATTATIAITAPGNYWVISESPCPAPVRIDTFHVLPGNDTVIHRMDTALCSGIGITFSVPTGYPSYTWSTGATSSSITVTTAGTFWFVAVGVCPAPTLIDTFVVTNPLLDTTRLRNDTTLCSNNSLTLAAPPGYANYLWSNASTTSTISVTTGGTYWLIAMSPCPTPILVDTFGVKFTIGDTTHYSYDSTICTNTPSIFLYADNGYDIYDWNTGSNATNIQVITQGTYYVAEFTGCNMRSDTFNVVFNPIPSVSLGPDTSICEGQSLVLTCPEPAGITYLWNDGSTNPSITVSWGGTYTLTVDENGCFASSSVAVTLMVPLQPLNLGRDTTLCAGQDYIIVSNYPNTTWNTGETGAEITVSTPGIYRATVMSNCGLATDSVIVSYENCYIWFPCAFTPNGDGLNDVFRPQLMFNHFLGYELSIFNRWGERVFHTLDYTQGWDGFYNGIAQDIDTYYYVAYYDLNGKPQMATGDLELIR